MTQTNLLHSKVTCDHCKHLDAMGECCRYITCGCRNTYREAKRTALANSFRVDYLAIMDERKR